MHGCAVEFFPFILSLNGSERFDCCGDANALENLKDVCIECHRIELLELLLHLPLFYGVILPASFNARPIGEALPSKLPVIT